MQGHARDDLINGTGGAEHRRRSERVSQLYSIHSPTAGAEGSTSYRRCCRRAVPDGDFDLLVRHLCKVLLTRGVRETVI
jgi:hypothetical protein